MYRIKEYNGWFYVEKRVFFFWWVRCASPRPNLERAQKKLEVLMNGPKYHYPVSNKN